MLTDTAIKHAKPKSKSYSMNDFNELSLFVASNGSKSWHFRFQIKYKKPDAENYVAQEQICFLALFSHGVAGDIWSNGKHIETKDLDGLKKHIDNGSLLFSKKGIIF